VTISAAGVIACPTCTVAPIATVSTNTTLDSTFYAVLCNAAGGAIAITLPSAASITPKQYVVKKIDSTPNGCTISPPSGNIDTLPSLVLNVQSQSVTLQANASQWYAE
jgi:hypothetical protein